MAKMPIEFQSPIETGTLTKITNNNYTLDTGNSSLKRQGSINILNITLSVQSVSGSWVQIGAMDVNSPNAVYTRIAGIVSSESNVAAIAVQIYGNKIYASGGINGAAYVRGVIPFFSE